MLVFVTIGCGVGFLALWFKKDKRLYETVMMALFWVTTVATALYTLASKGYL